MKILDIKIDTLTKTQVLDKIEDYLNSNTSHQVATVNAEFILAARNDKDFKEILNQTDLNIPDTISLSWATTMQNIKLTKIPILRSLEAILFYKLTGASIIFYPKYISKIIPERIPGSDFVWDLIELANKKKSKVFLLGGKKNAAQKTAEKFKAKYPELIICGVSEKNPDNPDLIDEIKSTRPDILIVAYGAPKQEKWLAKNLKDSGAKVGIGVGGTFDFISGKIKRAPKFIRSIGLEWLWRLVRQPSRIKRIYNAFIKFSLIVLYTKIKSNS